MKTKLILLFVLLLTSCMPAMPTEELVSATEIPVQAPTSTDTPMPIPANTFIPTDVPTATSLACSALLTPADGAKLPETGKVTFSWEPMQNAALYKLNIVLPSNDIASFDLDKTKRDQYIEMFSAGGEYHWQVIAIDADGNKICTSTLFSFSKLETQNINNSSNSNNGSSCPPVCGGDGGGGGDGGN
jgi:hypothetical protein